MSKNLYKDWREAVGDVKFKTQSPFPEMDYFLSPEPLKQCANSSYRFLYKTNSEEIKKYILEQIAILKFNNPSFDEDQIYMSLTQRIFLWNGNSFLNTDQIKNSLMEWIKNVFEMENYESLITFQHTRHWYGDKIESMPANKWGEGWGAKTKAKCKARTKFSGEAIREDIAEIAIDYQNENFNILPTKSYLTEASGYSAYQIETYGKDYFISKSENTKQKIIMYLKLYPELSLKELALVTNTPETTIRRYRKTSKGKCN